MSGFFTTIRNRKKPANLLRNSKCLGFLLQLEIVKNLLLLRDNMGNSRISRAPIFTMNNPPFQVFSTLLWGVKNLRASPSGFLLPRAKCKKPEMGGYLLSIFESHTLFFWRGQKSFFVTESLSLYV